MGVRENILKYMDGLDPDVARILEAMLDLELPQIDVERPRVKDRVLEIISDETRRGAGA